MGMYIYIYIYIYISPFFIEATNNIVQPVVHIFCQIWQHSKYESKKILRTLPYYCRKLFVILGDFFF
jgi:uncharacterized membrane protein